MSRKPKRPPAKPPRARRSFAGSALVLSLLAAGGLLWWHFGRAPAPPSPPPPADPQAAIERAIEMGKRGLYVESLPLLRAAAAAYPLSSSGHHDYATVILNAVHQNRRHLGHQEFVLRDASERVEWVRTALAELAAAERTARDPREHAWALRTRAQALGAWGFPWEALVGYRQAAEVDPAWTELSARADRVLDEMEHPERLKIER